MGKKTPCGVPEYGHSTTHYHTDRYRYDTGTCSHLSQECSLKAKVIMHNFGRHIFGLLSLNTWYTAESSLITSVSVLHYGALF